MATKKKINYNKFKKPHKIHSVIESAIEKLSKAHLEHIAYYDPSGGRDNEVFLEKK
jgi:hypothetical protein